MYLILKLTQVKGSYYLMECGKEAHDGLRKAIQGQQGKVDIIGEYLTAEEVWHKIAGNDDLRMNDYVIVFPSELAKILKDVFGITYVYDKAYQTALESFFGIQSNFRSKGEYYE